MAGHERDLAVRFWSKVNKAGACWLWVACTDGHGYGTISVKNRPVKAHRVAWELTYGPIPGRLWVLHKCDNPPCCNPAHLFLGTAVDNSADMVSKGRGRYTPGEGESNGKAKLTNEIVRSIRAEYAAGGITQMQLSAKYNVTQAQISLIVLRKEWKHI